MSSELPQSRIKKIVKLDPDYSGISASAVHLVTKATELFMQDITSKASIETRRQQRKKIVYDDFYTVIKNNQSLYFLSDVVPRKYKLRDLVDSRKVQLREDVIDLEVTQQEEAVPVDSNNGKRQGILAFTNNAKPEIMATPTKVEPISIIEIENDEDTSVELTKEEDTKDVMVIDDVEDEDDDEEMIDS